MVGWAIKSQQTNKNVRNQIRTPLIVLMMEILELFYIKMKEKMHFDDKIFFLSLCKMKT